jgi:hypothetical protein
MSRRGLPVPARRSRSWSRRRRHARARLSGGRTAAWSASSALAAESLEPRALLAVTAELVGGDLVIAYNDSTDVLADISSDGTKYTVSGTGLAPKQFKIADVTGIISVADNAAQAGQTFKVLSGNALEHPLQVNANVETTALNGGITARTPGAVSIGSGTISLANDISTAATNGNITLTGAVTLAANVGISTGDGAGDITFASTLDGAKKLYLTAGTGAVAFKGAVGSVTPLAGLILISASSTTADFSIKLARAADSTADGGLLVAAGVNNVKMTAAGSSITGFAGNGVWFLGGSTNSQLTGFTVSENSANGMTFAAGSYAGTTITGNTLSKNGDFTTLVGNGILVQGSDLMIGWDALPGSIDVRNNIFENARNGIEIQGAGAQKNTILSNAIYLNGQDAYQIIDGDYVLLGKGIALTTGGNGAQVAPQILGVVRNAATGKVHVQVYVPAAGSYLVQLFANTAADEQGIFPADAGGFQGRTFVGGSPSNTPAPVGTGKPIIGGTPVAGNTETAIEIDASAVAAGDWITATATFLNGTTPTNTSEFSAGVQVLAAPALAVGGDAPATWSTEYSYQRVNANQVRVNVPNGQSPRVLRALRNADLVFAPAGGGATSTVTRTANGGRLRTCNSLVLDLRPGAALPAGGGTVVVGPVGLPAARLYDASNPTSGPIITVGPATSPVSSSHYDMTTALTDPTVVGIGGKGAATTAQALAFVSRFQGGMRVASADVNGDGFVDLVTAPGKVGANFAANVFGDTPRIITIYNGNPAGSWRSSSINVSGESGLAAYTGGFQVSLANLRPENTGVGNAVAELVVASSNNVFVYEITAASRGAEPVISPVAALPPITTGGTITGLATGSFGDSPLADIVVATTTATPAQVAGWLSSANASLALQRTSAVTVYSAEANFAPNSWFTLASNVFNGIPTGQGRLQNVFLGGAALAVGDIDGAPDGRPELVLAAATNGLANFRVLSNSLVASGSQADIDGALTVGNGFTQASRAASTIVNGKTVWQPTGGPDYFTGMSSVPNAKALGANAPLSVAVVNSRGTSLRADVFAALGATNATNNAIRRISWGGSSWIGAATLAGPGTISVQPAAGSPKTRFPLGLGLRLG